MELWRLKLQFISRGRWAYNRLYSCIETHSISSDVLDHMEQMQHMTIWWLPFSEHGRYTLYMVWMHQNVISSTANVYCILWLYCVLTNQPMHPRDSRGQAAPCAAASVRVWESFSCSAVLFFVEWGNLISKLETRLYISQQLDNRCFVNMIKNGHWYMDS